MSLIEDRITPLLPIYEDISKFEKIVSEEIDKHGGVGYNRLSVDGAMEVNKDVSSLKKYFSETLSSKLEEDKQFLKLFLKQELSKKIKMRFEQLKNMFPNQNYTSSTISLLLAGYTAKGMFIEPSFIGVSPTKFRSGYEHLDIDSQVTFSLMDFEETVVHELTHLLHKQANKHLIRGIKGSLVTEGLSLFMLEQLGFLVDSKQESYLSEKDLWLSTLLDFEKINRQSLDSDLLISLFKDITQSSSLKQYSPRLFDEVLYWLSLDNKGDMNQSYFKDILKKSLTIEDEKMFAYTDAFKLMNDIFFLNNGPGYSLGLDCWRTISAHSKQLGTSAGKDFFHEMIKDSKKVFDFYKMAYS